MKKYMAVAVAVSIILILSISLRLYSIDHKLLDKDEAASLFSAEKESAMDTVGYVLKLEATPPTYFLILRYWIQAFGNSLSSIRLLSALFDISAGLVIFFIGKSLFHTRAGLYMMFLHAISPLNILYSQEARMYTMFFFFSTLSTYYLIKFAKGGKPLYYALSTIILLYSHYFGVIVLALQWLCYASYCILARKRLMADTRMILAIALAYLPALFLFISKIINFSGNYSSALVQKYNFPSFILISWFPGIILMLLFVAVMVILYLHFLKKNHKSTMLMIRDIRFGSLLVSSGYLLFLGMSYIFPQPIFLTRYPIFLYLVLFMISGYYLSVAKKAVSIIMILLIVFGSIYSVMHYYSAQTKPDWGGIMGHIRSERSQGDVVFHTTGCLGYAIAYYIPDMPVLDLGTGRPYDGNTLLDDDNNPDKIDDILVSGGWLILSEPYSRSELYLSHVKNSFTLLSEREYGDIKVYHFQKSLS